MSEPKTVREDLEGRGFFVDEFMVDGEPLVNYLPHNYFDAHIIPGADVVVTPQGLEDAAREVEDGVTVHFDEVGHITHVTMDAEAITRKALEAARIEVVNKVAYVQEAGNFDCRDSEGRHDVLPLFKGDRLFIKRAVTDKEDR